MDNPTANPATTDLRTRIAAAIERGLEKQLPSDLPDRYYKWIGYDTLADAVIRELKLQPETLCNPRVILSRLDGYMLAENRYMTRWATPWQADESPVK